MLINVDDDQHFQGLLDQWEQQLHYHKYPLINAGIRLHMARGSLAAQVYMNKRGEAALLRHYKHIYRNIYTGTYHQQEDKAAPTGAGQFMTEQMAYMRQNAASRVVGMSQAVITQIRDIVIRGVRDGLSNQSIEAQLYRAIPDIARGRAATIARTETHNAAMAALWATLQYRRIPVRTKTWWTAQDERVRHSHQALHGVTLPIDEPFQAASGPMMYPSDDSMGAGAEDIINCRCTPLFHT